MKPIVVLVLITLVVSLALAVTYRFTKVEDTGPDMAVINDVGKTVMPDANGFEMIKEQVGGASCLFLANNHAGIMVQAEAKGYNGNVPITFLVGFDKKGTITGLAVLEQQETPGLGDRVTEPDFGQQFVGKTGQVELKTGTKNSIDGITGATLSSKGVVAGVNEARKAFETVKGVLE